MRALLIAAVALALTRTAQAEVDWSKGLVTAPGVGLADRQAPNPAVARGPSRRRAEEAAKKALAAMVPPLPLAAGGTLGDKLGDPKIKARVDAAIEGAIAVTADPDTDGSWTVTMALPIEALRQALTAPRALPAAGDTGPTVIVLEGAVAAPAIGYTIGSVAAPVVWVKAVPAWAKDAPRIKAKGAAAGVIDADTGKATAATLFVILAKS